MPLHATLTADELSSMSKSDQFKILGVEEEKLALGIDPDEVLQFIGTRDDLVTKFSEDIPSFSPTEVQSQVDRYLMDGEMLDIFIKYSQRKIEDPDWEPIYAPEPTPFQKVAGFVSQYGIYVLFGVLAKDAVTAYLAKNGGGDGGVEVAAAGAAVGAADALMSSALDGIHHLSNVLV